MCVSSTSAVACAESLKLQELEKNNTRSAVRRPAKKAPTKPVRPKRKQWMVCTRRRDGLG